MAASTSETLARRRATYQDVLDAPAHQIAEIVDGTLYTHPRPAPPHAVATSNLEIELGAPFGKGRGGPGGWWIIFELELHVGAGQYVPDGQRSWGGGRGRYYNSTALLDAPGGERTVFMRETNANLFVMAQLETARAIENLGAILEVEGIDAWAGGPNDLAQSMGLPGQPEHPEVFAAQARVRDRIRAAGGKPHVDVIDWIYLPDLIVDGAQRFLADTA